MPILKEIFHRGVRVRRVAVLLFILAGLNPVAGGVLSAGRGDGFRGCVLSNVQAVADQDGTRAVRLADNRYRPDANTELLLHFDALRSTRTAWQYGKYTINTSQTPLDFAAPRTGSGCARYVIPSHRTLIQPGRGALLAETQDIGSFTFEFFIFPYSTASEEVVFERYGTWMDAQGRAVSGGIRCLFQEDRLRWEFVRFFRDLRGNMTRVEIETPRSLKLRAWQHIALSFSHFSGKMVLRVNGEETAVRWVTDSGVYGGSPLIPAFHARLSQPAVLGGSFRGKLDEFRISSVARVQFLIHPFVDLPGAVVSAVHDLRNNLAVLDRVDWSADNPAGSAVIVEYRISARPFRRNDAAPAWQRVLSGQRNFQGAASGRFFQWRARLLGVEQGRFSPVLRDISWSYRLPDTPLAPVGLKAEAGDGRITLSWKPNMDGVAGYMIYLGTEKGEYLHPLTPITVRLEQLDRQNPRYVIYGLENDRLYYIAVRAFVGESSRRLSPFSMEVYARPSFLLKQ